MGLAQSPRIVTDGLVFYYDQNNIKSYSGPAVQNLAKAIAAQGVGTATGYSSTGGTEVVDIPQIGPTTVAFNVIQNNYTSFTPNSTDCCPSPIGGYGGFTVSPSTLYTYAIVYKVLSGYTHPNYMYRYEYTANGGSYVTEAGVHNSSNRIHLGDGWYWAWGTFTTQPTTNWFNSGSSFYYRYSDKTDKLSVAKVMIVAGNYTGLHPKFWPNTNTTRSNTTAVADLSLSKNTITATSLTYAANGSVSFNGADRLNLTLSGSAASNEYTRIVWIKPTQSNADMKSVILNSIGNNSDMAVGIQNNRAAFHQYTRTNTSGTTDGDYTASGSTTLSTNIIYMIAVTVNRNISTNNINIYLNGQLDGTASLTLGAAASDAVIIGGPAVDGYGGARMFYGDCYSAAHYNRVLTAIEIQQNFNALRGRYGV